MGCEIVSIDGEFKSKEQAECFIECYNELMSELEPWFEEENKITLDDFQKNRNTYSCSLDGYGIFEDPNENAVANVVGALVNRHPGEDVKIVYDLSWDNCGECWLEEYEYEAETGKLTVHQYRTDVVEKDYDDDEEYDDEEYDEGLGTEVLYDKTYVFQYADGKMTVLSGEPDEMLRKAMGVQE